MSLLPVDTITQAEWDAATVAHQASVGGVVPLLAAMIRLDGITGCLKRSNDVLETVADALACTKLPDLAWPVEQRLSSPCCSGCFTTTPARGGEKAGKAGAGSLALLPPLFVAAVIAAQLARGFG